MSSGCCMNGLDASSHLCFGMGYTFMHQQAAAVSPACLIAISKWLIWDRQAGYTYSQKGPKSHTVRQKKICKLMSSSHSDCPRENSVLAPSTGVIFNVNSWASGKFLGIQSNCHSSLPKRWLLLTAFGMQNTATIL